MKIIATKLPDSQNLSEQELNEAIIAVSDALINLGHIGGTYSALFYRNGYVDFLGYRFTVESPIEVLVHSDVWMEPNEWRRRFVPNNDPTVLEKYIAEVDMDPNGDGAKYIVLGPVGLLNPEIGIIAC